MNKEVKNNKTHRNDSIPPQTPDVFLGNPVLDNVMSSVIALGSEFWSLQRRMNIIESFQPSKEETALWDIQRDRFIKRVYGFLQNVEPVDNNKS